MDRVRTVNELFALADRCARAEEGRLAPEIAKRSEEQPESSGKRKRSHKREPRQALAAEPAPTTGAGKRAKAEDVPSRATGGSWCPIHETDAHDARNCKSIQSIVEGRKKRQAERRADGTFGNCFNCNEPGHIARDCTAPRAGGDRGGGRGAGRGGDGGGRGGGRGNRGGPARGRNDNERDEGAGGEEHQGYQEARDAACIDGGASSLTSHREIKRLSREVYAIQPSADAQRPLAWSNVPITFDAADHPD